MRNEDQQEIFNRWLEEYKALLFKIIRAFASTEMDREDLFQEIAIQVWKSVPVFRNESAVSTWIYRIAFNTSIKWSNKEKKHRSADVNTEQFHEHILEKSGVENNRLNWLFNEISKLSPVDRSIMLMVLEELSYKEMASVIGISESNVGVKINRIKKHLAQQNKKSDL